MQQKFHTYFVILMTGFIMLTTGNTFAQSNVNMVLVLDSISKTPIAQVSIVGNKERTSAVTDENGQARVPSNATALTISCVGFETKTFEVGLSNENPMVVQLQPRVSSLAEVTISANATGGIFKTISDLDIHLRPINNSQEVLRIVPGLFIGQHAGGGKAEQIFLRGFDLDHGTDIQLSVDGLPVNMVSHAHGQGYADLHFVIPEMIDKVNFNKGPYFADKGNFTTAGFVEFKTKKYLDQNFLKLEAGQFNTTRGIVALNLLQPQQDQRTQSLYVAAEGSFTKGFFDSPQDFNRFNGLLKYHGKLTKSSTLTATLSGFTSKWNASGQIPDRAIESGLTTFFGAIDNTEGGRTSRHNVNVEILTSLSNGGILRNQLFASYYDFELYSNFTFFKEDPIDGDQIRQKEQRKIFGYHGSFQKESTLLGFRTETKAGLQIRHDGVDHLELTRTKNRSIDKAALMLGAVRETNTAAYFSQKVELTPRLEVTAALRGDYFSNSYADQLSKQKLISNSAILSPKLNFNYRLNDQVQLYLYNGRGFHSNDSRVATLQNGKKVLPPAYGSDLGGVFKLGQRLFLQSALWYLWLDQEFVYVGDEGVVEAGGQSQRYGLDVSVRYEVFKNLYLDGDISLATPRALGVDKSEHFLPLAPVFTSVGGFTYRKESGWNGSLRYRFMGDRPANETNTTIAAGYFVVDAAINYTCKRWEAGLSIQNLFNSRWKETQFDTESQLKGEANPVSEIHFTPGTPFFARVNLTLFF